jgi:hypothetical protein
MSIKIVKEFFDPLSKKPGARVKKLKVYEKYSVTEKLLFKEAENIILSRKRDEENKEKQVMELQDREKFPKNFIPKNEVINKIDAQYYDTSQPDCSELDTNEIRRVFGTYDRANLGIIKKNEIQYLFNDIKNILSRSLFINEKKFISLMLDFYARSGELCSISEVKKCFSKILHDYNSNSHSKMKMIPDLVYLRKLAFENEDKKKNDKIQNIPKISGCRNDIFAIKFGGSVEQVILNENKLQSIYK